MSKASKFVPTINGTSIDDAAISSVTSWSSEKLSQEPDIFTISFGVNTYTLSGIPVSPTSSKVLLNGVELDYTTMYTISSNQITLIPTGLEFYVSEGDLLKVWWY